MSHRSTAGEFGDTFWSLVRLGFGLLTGLVLLLVAWRIATGRNVITGRRAGD